MDNEDRLGSLKFFNSSRLKNDSLAMFLICTNSTMKCDQLNNEDKIMIDNLNKLFKDTLDKSNNFSKQLGQSTRKLFKSYTDFLIQKKYL
jgi:hypothetical protein